MIIMDWQKFLSYVNIGESKQLKFLGDVSSTETVGHLLVAMANTNGGKLFIGFDVKNYHFKGTELSREYIQDIIDIHITPKLELTIDFFNRDEKVVMIITLPENTTKPYYFNKMCFTMDDNNKPRLALLESDEMKEFKKFREEKNDSIHSDNEIEDITSITTELIDLRENDNEETAALEQSYTSPDVSPRVQAKPEFTYSRPFNVPRNKEETDDIVATPEKVADESTETLLDHNATESNTADIPRDEPVIYQQTGFSVNEDIDPNDLNDRQQRALDFVKREASIRNKMYRQLFSVSHKTAHLELVDLVAKGHIKSQGSGRSTCYVLKTTSV
jgi:predicted HTH transcriptional regulator